MDREAVVRFLDVEAAVTNSEEEEEEDEDSKLLFYSIQSFAHYSHSA